MGYSFDGSNKLISLTGGTTSFSVRDIWSRWVDWFCTSDNSKYLPAFYSLGGDEIDPVEGTYIPVYAFLLNGWKIKPQEDDHTLKVSDGILLVDGGGDPFVDTTGDYTVRINYQQPVQAISFDAEGGTSGPTAEEIATEILDTQNIEGTISMRELQRILLAVAAGKTTITEGEPVVVTFRDQADTKDRISAEMDGSERTDITLDVT